jgi:hypothetical protein
MNREMCFCACVYMKSVRTTIIKLRIHGQYFSGDGNAMVVKSLHCRREKEIACVSRSATATQSCAQSLPKFKIIWFSANDCRKLGGVVKEGQGWWMTCFLTSQWKALWRHILQVKYCRCSHLVRRQRNAAITHCVTIAAKILLVYQVD